VTVRQGNGEAGADGRTGSGDVRRRDDRECNGIRNDKWGEGRALNGLAYVVDVRCIQSFQQKRRT
jgi:hypothetical protein